MVMSGRTEFSFRLEGSSASRLFMAAWMPPRRSLWPRTVSSPRSTSLSPKMACMSSELPELLGLSDRIYTISEGRVTGVLDKEHADQESLMRLMTKTSTTPKDAA